LYIYLKLSEFQINFLFSFGHVFKKRQINQLNPC